jgi:mannitol 2-dehydrogenase
MSTPFELMKIRILNGGHATIAYPGGLMDIEFVHEAMANPLIRGLLNKVETKRSSPISRRSPNTDLRRLLPPDRGPLFEPRDRRYRTPAVP